MLDINTTIRKTIHAFLRKCYRHGVTWKHESHTTHLPNTNLPTTAPPRFSECCIHFPNRAFLHARTGTFVTPGSGKLHYVWAEAVSRKQRTTAKETHTVAPSGLMICFHLRGTGIAQGRLCLLLHVRDRVKNARPVGITSL